MTHRKKLKNKTIVKEAMDKMNEDLLKKVDEKFIYPPTNPDYTRKEGGFTFAGFFPALEAEGNAIEWGPEYENFTFPNDLDYIQPDSINGNLAIKFPE